MELEQQKTIVNEIYLRSFIAEAAFSVSNEDIKTLINILKETGCNLSDKCKRDPEYPANKIVFMFINTVNKELALKLKELLIDSSLKLEEYLYIKLQSNIMRISGY